MTENELKSVLAAHARDFANAIVELIRNAPLDEIAALTNVEALSHEEEALADEEEAASLAEPADENEVSILEHLNGAGPKGSTLPAWIISTHGELEADEHAEWEKTGKAVLDSLVARGVISATEGHRARGTVYTLLPV